jgi:hypothetical protein
VLEDKQLEVLRRVHRDTWCGALRFVTQRYHLSHVRARRGDAVLHTAAAVDQQIAAAEVRRKRAGSRRRRERMQRCAAVPIGAAAVSAARPGLVDEEVSAAACRSDRVARGPRASNDKDLPWEIWADHLQAPAALHHRGDPRL